MEILKLDYPDEILLRRAADVILAGGLVAFPTETVYGLGANGLDASAVRKVFAAKERPATDPLILHLASVQQLDSVAADVPPVAYQLAEKFWPGPLTLILRKQPHVPDEATAGLDTVAVRMPAHPVTLKFIELAGVPICGPSANRFSRPSPTLAEHVLNDLDGRVDMILDAGATQIGLESTIINLTGVQPVVVRPGGLSIEALQEVIPDVVFEPRYLSEHEAATSPGTMLKHYAPLARMMVFRGSRTTMIRRMNRVINEQSEKRVGVLALRQDKDLFGDADVIDLGQTLDEMGGNLFAGMRELDKRGVDIILAYLPPAEGIGLAIGDRLIRAAEGQVIDCG
jgi:L-threonylcarbamoyladenylate synthase